MAGAGAEVLTTGDFALALCYLSGAWGAAELGGASPAVRRAVLEGRERLLAALPRAAYICSAGERRLPLPGGRWGGVVFPKEFSDTAGNASSRGAVSCILLGQLFLWSGKLDDDSGTVQDSLRKWTALSTAHLRRPMKPPISEGCGRWDPLPCAPQPCGGAAPAIVEGQLYLCGGWDPLLGSEEGSTASEVWNPRTEAWEPVPPLPPQLSCRVWKAAAYQAHQLNVGPVLQHADVVCPGRLNEIMCGVVFRQGSVSCVSRFDAATGLWESLRPMLCPRAEAAVGLAGGRVYVCGGICDGEVLSSAERFDPASGRWEALPAMHQPRVWAAAGFMAGHLHVVGGFGSDQQPVDCVEYFDDSAHEWKLAQKA